MKRRPWWFPVGHSFRWTEDEAGGFSITDLTHLNNVMILRRGRELDAQPVRHDGDATY